MAVNALGAVKFCMYPVVEHDGRFPVPGLGEDDRVLDRIERAAYNAYRNRYEDKNGAHFSGIPHCGNTSFYLNGTGRVSLHGDVAGIMPVIGNLQHDADG